MRENIKITALGFVLGIVLSVSSLYGSSLLTSAPALKMPDFAQKTRSEVQAWIDTNSMTQVLLTDEYSETVSTDTVISQSVPARQEISSNTAITITLSKGFDPTVDVSLISFNGMTMTQISEWVKTNHLSNVTFQREESTTIEENYFIRSSRSGSVMKRSDPIEFVISSGSTAPAVVRVVVPNFTSYTKDEITQWGERNSITVNFKTENSSTVAEGRVISQSVSADQSIDEGSTLTIVLSSGSSTLVLDDFAGWSKKEVETYKTTNGLTNLTYTYSYSDTPADTVLNVVSPEPGTAIDKNTKIIVNISLGKTLTGDDSSLLINAKTLSQLESAVASINAKGASIKLTDPIYQEDDTRETNSVLYLSPKDGFHKDIHITPTLSKKSTTAGG